MHQDTVILLLEPHELGIIKEQATPRNAWEDFVLKGEVPHHFHGVGHPLGISGQQTVIARLDDGRESVGKLGAVGNDQTAACISSLSVHAEVSNLKQDAAHAFAQVQAQGLPTVLNGVCSSRGTVDE